ncbi:MAG: glycosyltransferase family 2 protein, partial [Planctomycetota bacterium]
MLVSIVIPLFNEEEGLEALFEGLELMRSAISKLGHRTELVFVDDGSIDGTSWELSVLYRARGDVRVLAHARNRGFGAALRTGIEHARGAVIVCYDADLPYPPEDAALLVEAVQGPDDADVATVSPWGPGGSADGVRGFRVLLSRGASFLYRTVLLGKGRGLTCFTASFRAYKGDLVRAVGFESNDYLATAEILTTILRCGYRVIEIPAVLRRRETGTSKMKVGRTVLRHLGLMLRVLIGRKPRLWEQDGPS